MKKKLQFFALAIFACLGLSNTVAAFPIVNLTGDGASSWTPQGSVALSTTDGVHYELHNFQIQKNGEIKFAFGTDSWDDIVGWIAPSDANGFPTGQAAPGGAGAGGSNIIGTVGYWNVFFNLSTRAYSFTVGVDPNAKINLTSGGSDVVLSTSNGVLYSAESQFLVAGGGKFQEVTSPVNPTGPYLNWSSADFPLGTGTLNGAALPITAGIFNVYFEKSTGNYEFGEVPVSLIGNLHGAGWGWNTSDVDELTTLDNVNYELIDWVGEVRAINSVAASSHTCEFKLIDNHGWSLQFGNIDIVTGLTPLTGFMQPKAPSDPPNCKLPEGVYDIAFNRSTLAYTFTYKSALSTKKNGLSNFSVYPNPTSNTWNFTSKNNGQIGNVQISDITGKVVLTQKAKDSLVSVNAAQLSKGVYFARVTVGNANETIKLIKN